MKKIFFAFLLVSVAFGEICSAASTEVKVCGQIEVTGNSESGYTILITSKGNSLLVTPANDELMARLESAHGQTRCLTVDGMLIVTKMLQ